MNRGRSVEISHVTPGVGGDSVLVGLVLPVIVISSNHINLVVQLVRYSAESKEKVKLKKELDQVLPVVGDGHVGHGLPAQVPVPPLHGVQFRGRSIPPDGVGCVRVGDHGEAVPRGGHGGHVLPLPVLLVGVEPLAGRLHASG